MANILLLVTAVIWGFGFVAQILGMTHLGPFAFIGLRFLLGAASLLPVIWWMWSRLNLSADQHESLFWGSLTLGIVLFCASAFQQVGLLYTTASNAGFITGLYMVFVPVMGIALGIKTGRMTWLGGALAAVGLVLLGFNESYRLGYGDALQLLGAVVWAVHILVIDHFARRVSGLLLAVGQFLVCGTLGLFVSLTLTDEVTTSVGIINAAPTLAYAGILTVGVAYTLQVIAQADANPSHAAIILSLEAVFGALGGYLILDEWLTPRQMFGCALMLGGMIMSQLANQDAQPELCKDGDRTHA